MPPDELEKLAAEGRARKAEADARLRETQRDEQETRRREHVEVLHGSVSTYARFGWVLAGVPCGAVLALGCALAFPATAFIDRDGEAGGIGSLVSLLVFFSGFFVTRGFRGWFGRRAVERERAWLQSLPFPLTGYLEALEGSANDGKLTLTLTYEDTVPKDVGFVSDVFAAVGGTVTGDGREHRVSTSWDFESSVSTNHHVVAWVHRVTPALAAVHAKWRLSDVRVKPDWQ